MECFSAVRRAVAETAPSGKASSYSLGLVYWAFLVSVVEFIVNSPREIPCETQNLFESSALDARLRRQVEGSFER